MKNDNKPYYKIPVNDLTMAEIDMSIRKTLKNLDISMLDTIKVYHQALSVAGEVLLNTGLKLDHSLLEEGKIEEHGAQVLSVAYHLSNVINCDIKDLSKRTKNEKTTD